LNLKVHLKPGLLSQRHETAWKAHTLLTLLHSGSTYYSHQQFQPTTQSCSQLV
jgi:hypothetical protein